MPEVYTGSSYVRDTDFRYVKWVGRTKGGKSVQIELERAFCRSNPDWSFEEKNDTTAEVEFEGAYTDENLAKDDRTEPWKMTIDGVEAGQGEIVLGVGKFYIGATKEDAAYVGLTRGGGSFVVEREFREINADGDPGLVEGRIEKEMARPKLKLTALQWLTKVSNLYNCVQSVQG
jgi:hypothetical protein